MAKASKKVEWKDSLEINFPKAVEGKSFTKSMIAYLKKQGINPENTVFGYSTCPDEINRSITNFRDSFDNKEFPLGGLTGYPFVGKTGFGAFSHHAPDLPDNGKNHGNVIIFYAAHTGINEAGEIGKILRHNQGHDSTSCGAAFVFLNKFKDSVQLGKPYQLPDRDADPEQFMVEQLLLPYGESILNSKDPAKALVEANFEIIEKRVNEIINDLKHHFEGKIVMIGGIMLNLHESQPSYFEPRKIVMIEGEKEKDLMPEYRKIRK